jgi:hypothetical protein
MARGTTAPPLRPGHRRRLLTVPGHRRLLTVSGLAGVGYSLSWIAGLAVPAPSPGFGAAGPALVLLLAFMTGSGIMTGMTAGRRDR